MLHLIIYFNRANHKKYKVVVLLAKLMLLRAEVVMCLSRHLLLGFFFLNCLWNPTVLDRKQHTAMQWVLLAISCSSTPHFVSCWIRCAVVINRSIYWYAPRSQYNHNRFTGLAKVDAVLLSHMQFGVVRRDLPGFSSNFCFLQYIETAQLSHKHR